MEMFKLFNLLDKPTNKAFTESIVKFILNL